MGFSALAERVDDAIKDDTINNVKIVDLDNNFILFLFAFLLKRQSVLHNTLLSLFFVFDIAKVGRLPQPSNLTKGS